MNGSNAHNGTRWKFGLVVAGIALAMAVGAMQPAHLNAETSPRVHDGKYIGPAKCKNCHSKEVNGNQYAAWLKMKHAKAYDLLGTPEAAKAGQEKGVASPQQDAKCLKCHVTAYEVPADLRSGYDQATGVSCESCHGPGGKHLKARMAAAAGADEGAEEDAGYVELPAGEVIMPNVKTCKGCHNSESPTHKDFKCEERMEKVLHLNPKHKQDQKKLIKDLCADK